MRLHCFVLDTIEPVDTSYTFTKHSIQEISKSPLLSTLRVVTLSGEHFFEISIDLFILPKQKEEIVNGTRFEAEILQYKMVVVRRKKRKLNTAIANVAK